MPDVILKHVPGMKGASGVPVLQADALQESVFLGEYVANSQPCVIKGAVKHWAAMEKWRDKDHLKSRSGHHDVIYAPHENHVSLKRTEPGKIIVSFADAIELLNARETKIGACGTSVPVELQVDMGGFPFLSKREPGFLYPSVRYFFFRDAGSSWHYHPFDETLMCQIVGAKKIGLLRAVNPLHNAIRDIFFKEDYYDHVFAFNGLDGRALHWYTATVEEGDALYIPPLWWHGVIPLDKEFGVTAAVPWRSPSHVISNTIKQMAAGEVDMVGTTTPAQFMGLLEVARKMGVEQELGVAWKRGIRE